MNTEHLDNHFTVRIEPMGNAADGSPVPLPLFADGTLYCLNEIIFAHGEDDQVFSFYTEREPEWTSDGWVVRCGDGEIELGKCYPNNESAKSRKGTL